MFAEIGHGTPRQVRVCAVSTTPKPGGLQIAKRKVLRLPARPIGKDRSIPRDMSYHIRHGIWIVNIIALPNGLY